ncbi:hypothetical protein PC9H_004338 [Pleurotus ostreatus]|uniref:Uncharacterized protein n=1 Tax=Pleurotus ostreatus TaxID=5322 RepID=A0A8H7DW46_PLEOS|nr:uncharacterized protein PC9H_004338 [Pleurotus ostreatus]KAF7437497.1 hypothetical protein PC9H_004338 [Pleurotus ostreatus]
MSYARVWNELMNPETAGSLSDPTAEGAAEEPSILCDPGFSYGLDMKTFLGDKDSDERRRIDGVGEISDGSECDDIYGSGEDADDDACATSNVLETFAQRSMQNPTPSAFAAANAKDQHPPKDSQFLLTQKISRARNKAWQHETLPLYQEFVARQIDPPSGERVSMEYNHATQFMLGGLQLAGNRTAASCEPCQATDDQLPQTETLGCFTHMEAWARQILLNHDIPDDQYDESVLYSLMVFAETFYEGFVHSTEQLLKESRARQAQRHSPILELQDFSFGVARKLQDLQRKVDYITGKLDRASEKEDVPRQTRYSKVQAIKQNLDEQLLLGRVVKDLATTAKPKDKQKGAVSTPAPARKPKQKDDKATPRPTPDAESISTAPKRKGRPPKISRNVQPIRAISPTSAYRGGTGKNAALLENTLRATAVMNNAMAPPPAPAPTMLHLEVPSGWAVPQAEEQSTSSGVSASSVALSASELVPGPATTSSLHLPISNAASLQRDLRPANLAGSTSASGSLPPIFVPYDYPTPTDSLPPSRDSSVLRVLGGEAAQHATPPTLTALSGLSSPDTLPGTVSDDCVTTTPDVDADVTPKAAPRRSGRKVNPTPKAEELMQTRARAKARVEKKAVGSLTKEVGMSTRSLTGKAGRSTPTPQPLVRKRKLGD